MSVTDATIEAAALRLHMDLLDSPSPAVRLQAGVEVCRLAGVLEAVRGLAADGALRPPPAWPLVDVVPMACVAAADGRRHLRVTVRTRMGGVMEQPVMVAVPIADGALADAVDRGRFELGRRIEGMVVG